MRPRLCVNPVKSLSCAVALALAAAGTAIGSELPANRHISTTGYGEVRVQPDTVVIQLEVSATEASGAAAKKAVDERVNRFLAASERAGLDKKQISAGQLHINARWEYRNQERVFSGYQASRNLQIRLTDLERLSAVVDMALDNGISNVQQLSYEHSKADELTRQAHQKAVENSKSKAESLAAAYGARLGLIYSIHYQRANIQLPPPIRHEAAMARADFAADSAGVYLQEEIVFSDSIEVVFDLSFAD